MKRIWILAALGSLACALGVLAQQSAPLVRVGSQPVSSLTQLVTPQQLRGHGTENLVISGPGIEVEFVGQAGETVFGELAPYRFWQVKVSGDYSGTGWSERFLFCEPFPLPTGPSPVLVFHHGFGKTDVGLFTETDFVTQAALRGWYVVAPIATSNKHFSSSAAQANVEFVLEWLLSNASYSIDPNRIYGVGFSMGGGLALSHAARHLDPEKPMFAALINHTGTVCLPYVYENETEGVNGGRYILEFWYSDWHGGIPGYPPQGVLPPPEPHIPLADPLALQRHSLIDFDPLSGTFLDEQDMVRNIRHIPLKMLRASGDPIDYLVVQTDQLDLHLQSKYGYVNGSSTYQYDILDSQEHEWGTLDENVALDFLEQHSLTLPTSGQVLADRNARWFYFTTSATDVDRNAAFSWDVATGSNTLSLTECENLTTLTVDTLLAGLDPAVPLEVVVGASVGESAPDIFLRDFGSTPTQVLLDDTPTNSWVMIDTLVVLLGQDAGAHTWRIEP